MSGHVNRRGWIVRDSVASDDCTYCVDFFEDPAGGFGFEQFRSDPEDGGWTAISGFAATRYDTLDEALAQALDRVPWLGAAVRRRR